MELTKIKNISELEAIFKEAYESGENSVAVEITIPHRTETEIVFHRRQSIFNRLNYYNKVYDENLIHKKVDGLKIIAVGFGKLSLFE